MEGNTMLRSLDTASIASADLMGLNNSVVNMRRAVKSAKVQVIHKLTKCIRNLKNKKGSEEQKGKNLRKAERLLEEIYAIKALKADRVSKYALASTSTFEEVCKQTTSAELRSLARLAQHKHLAEKVNTFRSKHSDWLALTSYLLVKQTGRRFKSKKQKAASRHTANTNIIAAKSMTRSYLTSKLGYNVEIEKLMTEPKMKRGAKMVGEVSVTADTIMPPVSVQNVNTNELTKGEKANNLNIDPVNTTVKIGVASAKKVSIMEKSRGKTYHSDSEDNESESGNHKLAEDCLQNALVDGDGLGVIANVSVNEDETSDSDLSDSKLRDSKEKETSESELSDNELRDRKDDKTSDSELSDGEPMDNNENAEHSTDISDVDVNPESDKSDTEYADNDKSNLMENSLTKPTRLKHSDGLEEKESSKTSVGRKNEMVVKVLDLKSEGFGEIILSREIQNDDTTDILLRQPPGRSKLADDPFFLCGDDKDTSDGEEASGSDPSDTSENEEDQTESRRLVNNSVFISLGSANANQNRRPWERRGRGLVRGVPQRKQFGFQTKNERFGGTNHNFFREGQLGHRGAFRGHFRGRGSGSLRSRGQRGSSSRHNREFVSQKREYVSKEKYSSEHKKEDGFRKQSTSTDNSKTAEHSINKKEKLDSAEKIHPSWEASKKRKEQQSVNFQGKRTKFEDD